MSDLIVLAVAICLTAMFYVWRRATLHHSLSQAIMFVALYCGSLGLALRFGARTYPGIYFSESAFLNGLLNGNGLFVSVGYSAVLVAGATDTLVTLKRPASRTAVISLAGVKRAAVCLATAISLYGFYWSAVMQRLP